MFDSTLLEFHEKNEFFLFGYERGVSPFEWSKLDLGSFIEALFQRGNRLYECFEEIQSPEYQIWDKQRFEDEIDYSEYRCFRYNPIVFSKEGKKCIHRILLKDDMETMNWIEGRQFAIMPQRHL